MYLEKMTTLTSHSRHGNIFPDRHLNLKNSHQTMPFGLIEIEDGGREQMTHVIQEGKESE